MEMNPESNLLLIRQIQIFTNYKLNILPYTFPTFLIAYIILQKVDFFVLESDESLLFPMIQNSIKN